MRGYVQVLYKYYVPFYMGLEHMQILVSMGEVGINPVIPWTPRYMYSLSLYDSYLNIRTGYTFRFVLDVTKYFSALVAHCISEFNLL